MISDIRYDMIRYDMSQSLGDKLLATEAEAKREETFRSSVAYTAGGSCERDLSAPVVASRRDGFCCSMPR